MNELTLVFKGIKPISKQNAHGISSRGTRLIKYIKPEYAHTKNSIIVMAKQQMYDKEWSLYDYSDGLICNWIVHIKKGEKKFDCDNALGIFFDALEGIVYKNDVAISEGTYKRIAKQPDWLVTLHFIKELMGGVT